MDHILDHTELCLALRDYMDRSLMNLFRGMARSHPIVHEHESNKSVSAYIDILGSRYVFNGSLDSFLGDDIACIQMKYKRYHLDVTGCAHEKRVETTYVIYFRSVYGEWSHLSPFIAGQAEIIEKAEALKDIFSVLKE